MNTPTIYDIKYHTLETEPYFFSKNTMKFFGQTMKSFKVRKSPTGRIFIYAPMKIDRRTVGYTFREYINGKLQDVRQDDGSMIDNNLFEITNYIHLH